MAQYKQKSMLGWLILVMSSGTFMLQATPLERRRFGEEQKIQQLVNTFKLNGQPGCENGSVGGPAISKFLAAAPPCDLIQVAEKVLQCGGQVNDARAVLELEKNFNPFVAKGASVCLDKAQPANPQLRGILPLVDPALPGAAEYNRKSRERNNQIKSGQLNGASLAQGKSIADQMVELGFTAIQGVNANPPAGQGNGANTSGKMEPTQPGTTSTSNTPVCSGNPNQFEINKAKRDFKGSHTAPGFSPFDCVKTGDMFTTGPCSRDDECQTGCCDGTKCRAPDALKGTETCRNGLKPDFSDGGRVKFVMANTVGTPPAGSKAPMGTSNNIQCPGQFRVNIARKDFKGSNIEPGFAPFDCVKTGNGFTTSPCTRDDQCQTGCCDGTRCRAPDALKGTETCRNGLKPDFSDGGRVKFVNAGASGNGSSAGSNPPTCNSGNQSGAGSQPQNCEAQFQLNKAKKDFKGSHTAPGFSPFDCVKTGDMFTTGPCTRDDECQTGCCDGTKCRAPDALKGTETCRNGLKPDFSDGGRVKFVKGN